MMNTHPLSRRRFLATSTLAALACDGPAIAVPATRPKHKYIDIHTHLGAFHVRRELSAELLVRFMDEHDIEKACVLPLISPEAAPVAQPVTTAIAAFKQFPERIIPFCTVDPRAVSEPGKRPGHVTGVKGIIDILKRYQDAGCRGFGEHKTGLWIDAPQQMMLYEACETVGLPILFHLDDIRNPDTPDLPRLENVLKAFPKLPLIGHACGFWSSISGNATQEDFGRYPKVPLPITPGGALDRLMDAHPNLYCDISEPGGAIALTRDPQFAREFVLRRADRLLFGSDYLAPDQQIPQFDILAAMNLPEDVQYKIHRGNAIRILKLGGA